MRRFLLLLAVLIAGHASAADTLVVYSERKEPLFTPILDAYTKQTGVEVQLLTDQAQVLIERIVAEGERTRADVLVTVDAGNLWQATERGVLAKTESSVLDAVVPPAFRDPEGRWYAITERARVIVHSTDRVEAGELSSYEDLADPKWKGRLCLRSSKKVYNQSLVATMIARLGAQETERVVRGWVDNLAAPPFADDTQLAQAIAAGQCDVGIINTYYLGRLIKDDPDFPVTVFWPNQDSAGVHVNISGAGVVKHSDQKTQAQKLLEWMAGDEVQHLFAGANIEFPAKPGIEVDPVAAAWGPYKADPVNVVEAGRRQAEAVRLMDRAGWN